MIKTGIAGSGLIVPDFLRAAALIPEFEMIQICSTPRSLSKAEKLAEEWKIASVCTDYEEMLTNPEIDVIYIAVPNHLHYRFSRLALEHGKSVICEKPFCSTLEETRILKDLAKQKGLFLFEAISNQYFPNYEKVRELLPDLGQMKIAELNYSQYSRRYDEFKKGNVLPVFDPAKSGGALMDLNVYNIHFLTGLFGKPESVFYLANIERGIDTSGILILSYPDFQAVCIAAKDCKAPCSISLQGDQGVIHSDDAANVFSGFWYEDLKGRRQEFHENRVTERLYYELLAFAEMYSAKNLDLSFKRLEHSILVQEILDEARTQAQIRIIASQTADSVD